MRGWAATRGSWGPQDEQNESGGTEQTPLGRLGRRALPGAEDGGYGQPQGYGQDPGYGAEQGYGADQGYGGQPGYGQPPAGGFGSDNGNGYQQQGWPSAPAFGDQPPASEPAVLETQRFVAGQDYGQPPAPSFTPNGFDQNGSGQQDFGGGGYGAQPGYGDAQPGY